jgi:ABC-type transport system involved in multi-copper enzyme maturation permease subunit
VPILALTPYWGGVDPKLLLAAFTATALTMLSLAGLSLLNSVYAPRPIDAVLRTYFHAGLFLLFGSCVPGLNLGHPAFAMTLLSGAWGTFSSPNLTLLCVLIAYGMVHVLIGLTCIVVAIIKLRSVVLGVNPVRSGQRPAIGPHVQALPAVTHTAFVLPPPRRLPGIRDHPLLWKELYLDQHFTWERIHPLLAMLLVFVGVCSASIGVITALSPVSKPDGWPGVAVNYWIKIVGTATALGLWLVQGFYAAAAVSRERERQTLEGLLTLPESREAVLFVKWLGNVLSTRQAWWCLGAIWGWGLLTGGLHVLSLPLVVLAWAVITAFVASLGLYCSVVSRTTLRAIVRAFVSLLVIVGGTWLLASAAGLVASWLPGPLGTLWEYFAEYGLPLPRPLLEVAFPYHQGAVTPYDNGWTIPLLGVLPSPGPVLAALAGLLFYLGAAWLLWRAALAAFRQRG